MAKSTLSSVGYMIALLNNPDGRISEPDYKAALKEVGGNLSDPDAMRAVIEKAYDRGQKRIRERIGTSKEYREARKSNKDITIDSYLEEQGFKLDENPFERRRMDKGLVEKLRGVPGYENFTDAELLGIIRARQAELED